MLHRALRFLAIAGIGIGLYLARADAGDMPANAVIMKNFDFAPMTLTIKAGDMVTWKNTDGEPHTVTSLDGLFRSGAIDTDETYSFKFAKPGTYKYICSIHPRMMATIIVK